MENQNARIDARWLVVTDLDGTLLDHHSYSYQPALPALHALGAKNIPVILCSSKTRTEIEQLREELALDAPYVVENGAAICGAVIDDGAGEKPAPGKSGGDLLLGRPYREIIEILHWIRREHGIRFRGFHDMSVDEVVALTGLSRDDAARARAREFSEPLVWEDSDASRQWFLRLLGDQGLRVQQGGRFLTVSGLTDKGRAVAALRQLYGSAGGLRVIALGDSPNDEAMLDAADVAVIVESDNSAKLNVSKPGKIIYTQARGPAGWNSAILELLEDYDNG